MAYAGAIANQQLNEDTKRPDGQRFGIPGGKNATGPNHPAMQASAGAVLVVAAILSGAGLEKKIQDAVNKGSRLVIQDSSKAAEKAAEELVAKFVKQYGPVKGPGYLAATLHQNGAIGPYNVMRKFTDNLGGKWQAHHILEVQKMKDFKLGNPDFAPSVILSDAEHKVMSKKLNDAMVNVRSTKKLWDKYQEVYADHADWIKAIEPYFQKQLR